MISGQVDRLRTAAQTYRRLGNHTAEGMLLDAADTICELQTENAKLRNDAAETALMLGVAWERCSKLREFIDLKETCWKYVGWCDECPYNGVDDEHDDCNCTVREKVNSLARELGVEVDE